MSPPRYLELRCQKCLRAEVCGPAEIAERLRRAGKVRAGRSADLGVLYELFRAEAPRFICANCGSVGMQVREASDPEANWPGPVPCAACGKPIDPERLEVFPNARFCAACQRAAEEGRPNQERDFCPRCGAPLEIRVVERGRKTRYVMRCTGNPPCDLE